MLNIIICAISGILLSLAFPKASQSWLAWMALVPLIYYTFQLSWKQALLCGLAFGVAFFAGLIYWISLFGYFPLIALSIYQALYLVAFVAAAKFLGTRLGYLGRLALLPALWVVIEWTRGLGTFGFTWGDLGYSQYKALSVIQIASITGTWGISFLLILCNTALANFLSASHINRRSSAYPQLALTAMIILAIIVYGLGSIRTQSVASGKEIRTAIVQGNISQDTNNWVNYADRAWHAYTGMTLKAAKEGADLIVWPETVVPGNLGSDPGIQARLQCYSSIGNADLLVGGWDEPAGVPLNSAFVITPKAGVVGRYAKVHLVPFGEFVPLRHYLPFLKYYSVRACDTSPGCGYNVIDTGKYKIGTAICFESAFSYITRRMAQSGANVLCVITDDEWFGKTAAAEQHLSKSVLRAVETRRYLIRGASTGISCMIAPTGRVLSRSRWWHPELLTGVVRLRTDSSFYVTYGDWLIYASQALILVFLIMLVIERHRARRSRKTEQEQDEVLRHKYSYIE